MKKKYIVRDIEKTLTSAAKQFPAVIVTGPRQSGKTTLLKHLFSKTHKYVSMDDPDTRFMATREPELFFDNHIPPIIIDEIQYAPKILSYIKMMIDRDRDRCGRFIITGSQLFPMMANVSESLAGRTAVFTLLPLSYNERFGSGTAMSFAALQKGALAGGFPEVVLKKTNTELWFSGYLQTYLERDVRQLRQIGDLGDFQGFLQLIASFNGQVISLSSISRDLGVAVNTVKAWISILEASGQVALIKPFYLNKGKRIIKSYKLYFLDTGLLSYLTGLTSTDQIFRGPASGQFFETVVVGEMIKKFYNAGRVPNIFWWRTSKGEEVDFIVEDRGKIVPIEVKLSGKATTDMVKNLISFNKLFDDKVKMAFLVNMSKVSVRLDNKITALPFSDFIRAMNRG